MSLTLKLNGAEYINFMSAKVARSVDVLTGAFSFVSSADKNNLFPVRVGDTIEVLADGVLVLTGYVEGLQVHYNVNSHAITVNGRGVLADLIDSSLKGSKEFTGSVTLASIARTILDDLGLTSVDIVNNAGTISSFSDTDITSADIGQPAFEFLELFARKRQVLLNEDAEGNLVLARGGAGSAPAKILNQVSSNDNNVVQANFGLDYKNRYNQYLVRSQLNPLYQELGITPGDVSDQRGSAQDAEIRGTRFFEMNAEESQDSGSAGERALWEANIRKARSFNYNVQLYGHTIDGRVWEPNTLVKVQDDFCNINAEILIKSVELVYSTDNGSITNLVCAPKDAYQLEIEQAQREASTSDSGKEFVF